MEFYLQGLTMGIAYVAPLGIQNMFIINTALTQPKRRIFATAFIIIFFDITLQLACFFGIGAIMAQSKKLEMLILLFGSLIILYMGIKLLLSKDSLSTEKDTNISILKVITTACVVTWFNPQAIVDGSMLLGAFTVTFSTEESYRFLIGVASASFIWFLGLSAIIPAFSSKFTDKTLRIINTICGVVIIFYGIKLLLNFFKMIGF